MHATALPTGIWKLDPERTVVVTQLKKVGFVPVTATFAVADSTIMVATSDEGELGGSVSVDLHADSYDSGQPKRDAFAKGSDFLDTENYPDIGLVGTSMEPTTTGYIVTANVTVKERTSELTFDVTDIASDGPTASFTATTTVDRKDFGIGKVPSFLIGHHLDITVTAHAARQS